MEHRIERRRGKLRVVLEIPLEGSRDAVFSQQLQHYLHAVATDINDVLAILEQEDEYGTVKWFDEAKGYGFIHTVDSRDVFVHHSQVVSDDPLKSLATGQRVRFKRRVGRRSLEALDVRPDADTD